MLFLSVLSCVYFYFRSPKVFLLFFRTMRLSRHIYYSVIFTGGYLLGVKISGFGFGVVYFISGLLLINILFAASLVVNNIYDKQIDALNSKDNILNSRGFTLGRYYMFFYALLGLSLPLSFAVSLKVFFITALIHFFSWTYSCPPLRLKKVFLVNTLLIAISTLLAMLLGFAASADSIRLFPAGLALAVIAVLFLFFNTPDVNDYKGDKKHGVKTMVTVFGQAKGRLITAVSAFAGYLLVPILLNAYGLLIPSAIIGAVTYMLINMKTRKINETLIFALFFAYAAAFAFINPV
jgi:4-hydroxybenzoate polyprenyltransferase